MNGKRDFHHVTVGFTFVELLVSMTIGCVIISLIFVASGPSREKSRQAVCISNLRQIGQALEMYRSDNDSISVYGTAAEMGFPPSPLELIPYLRGGMDVFKCPDFDEAAYLRQTGAKALLVHYGWVVYENDPLYPHTEPFESVIQRRGERYPVAHDSNHDFAYGRRASPSQFVLVLRLDGSVHGENVRAIRKVSTGEGVSLMPAVKKIGQGPFHPEIRKKRTSAIAVGLTLASAVGAIIAYNAYFWWTSPEHCIQQFVAKSYHADPGDMLTLMPREELKITGISQAKWRLMLRGAAGVDRDLRLSSVAPRRLNARQSQYNRLFRVSLHNSDGLPVLNDRRTPAHTYLMVYQTQEGWKISASRFLYNIIAARHGPKDARARYRDLCQQYGVNSKLFDTVDFS